MNTVFQICRALALALFLAAAFYPNSKTGATTYQATLGFRLLFAAISLMIIASYLPEDRANTPPETTDQHKS